MTTAWQKAYRGSAPKKPRWKVESVKIAPSKPGDRAVEVIVDLGSDGRLIATYHEAGDFISSAKGTVRGVEREKIMETIRKSKLLSKSPAQLDAEIAAVLAKGSP
jgi:hypothetical protein